MADTRIFLYTTTSLIKSFLLGVTPLRDVINCEPLEPFSGYYSATRSILHQFAAFNLYFGLKITSLFFFQQIITTCQRIHHSWVWLVGGYITVECDWLAVTSQLSVIGWRLRQSGVWRGGGYIKVECDWVAVTSQWSVIGWRLRHSGVWLGGGYVTVECDWVAVTSQWSVSGWRMRQCQGGQYWIGH